MINNSVNIRDIEYYLIFVTGVKQTISSNTWNYNNQEKSEMILSQTACSDTETDAIKGSKDEIGPNLKQKKCQDLALEHNRCEVCLVEEG